MVELKEGEVAPGTSTLPGRWKEAVRDGKRTANVSCPGCGYVASLLAHKILEDGLVQPSVICPKHCGFRDHVKLVGWKP